MVARIVARRLGPARVLDNYEQVLGCELEHAVEDLRRANAIRELLLAAAGARVPAEKADAVRAWMAWAARWADSIDPRTDPMRVARIVKPDVARMSEQEFSYWRDWPQSTQRVEAGYGQAFEPWSI